MADPSSDPSVGGEPHFQGGRFESDPSEKEARRLDPGLANPSEEERVDQNVWDEPSLSPEIAGSPPPGAPAYRDWLQQRRVRTHAGLTWAVTLGVALGAGPWAILGALLGGGETLLGVLLVTVFGPITEEVMKIALALYVVERRPFLFRSAAQILLCAAAGGYAFSVIENLVYLHFHVPVPTPGLAAWRWSVCSALHTFCSLVAGLGLARIWRDTWERLDRPRLSMAFPYLVAAVLIHGTYNGLAVLLERSRYHF